MKRVEQRHEVPLNYTPTRAKEGSRKSIRAQRLVRSRVVDCRKCLIFCERRIKVGQVEGMEVEFIPVEVQVTRPRRGHQIGKMELSQSCFVLMGSRPARAILEAKNVIPTSTPICFQVEVLSVGVTLSQVFDPGSLLFPRTLDHRSITA